MNIVFKQVPRLELVGLVVNGDQFVMRHEEVIQDVESVLAPGYVLVQ